MEILSHHRSLQVYVTNIIAYPNSCVIVQAGVCVQKAVGIQIACGVYMLRNPADCRLRTYVQRYSVGHDSTVAADAAGPADAGLHDARGPGESPEGEPCEHVHWTIRDIYSIFRLRRPHKWHMYAGVRGCGAHGRSGMPETTPRCAYRGSCLFDLVQM